MGVCAAWASCMARPAAQTPGTAPPPCGGAGSLQARPDGRRSRPATIRRRACCRLGAKLRSGRTTTPGGTRPSPALEHPRASSPSYARRVADRRERRRPPSRLPAARRAPPHGDGAVARHADRDGPPRPAGRSAGDPAPRLPPEPAPHGRVGRLADAGRPRLHPPLAGACPLRRPSSALRARGAGSARAGGRQRQLRQDDHLQRADRGAGARRQLPRGDRHPRLAADCAAGRGARGGRRPAGHLQPQHPLARRAGGGRRGPRPARRSARRGRGRRRRLRPRARASTWCSRSSRPASRSSSP